MLFQEEDPGNNVQQRKCLVSVLWELIHNCQQYYKVQGPTANAATTSKVMHSQPLEQMNFLNPTSIYYLELFVLLVDLHAQANWKGQTLTIRPYKEQHW